MPSRPALVTLALAALALASVLGGVVGAALSARGPERGEPRAAQPAPPREVARAPADPELARAIEELAREVRRLGARGADSEASQRVPLGNDGGPPADPEALVAALDRLSTALETSRGRVSSGGIGITPLVMPAGTKRLDLLEPMVGREHQELSREHRFMTYQQVLDRFGPPDEVGGDGNWYYQFESAGERQHFTFQFQNGYLNNIWN